MREVVFLCTLRDCTEEEIKWMRKLENKRFKLVVQGHCTEIRNSGDNEGLNFAASFLKTFCKRWRPNAQLLLSYIERTNNTIQRGALRISASHIGRAHDRGQEDRSARHRPH